VSHLGYVGIFAPLVASAILALFSVVPRRTISRQLDTPDVRITIKAGDLFEEVGNIVIGMNDVFDTELGEIINPKSIQGQFLNNVYTNDRAQLDLDLEGALHDVTGQKDDDKSRGKNVRYPIGTVATIKMGPNRYFCVAYSRMQNSLQATSDIRMLRGCLDELWDQIRVKGQREKVAMAVLGSDLARLGHLASHSDLIKLIVSSFILTSREKMIAQELVVVIHPPNLEKVNLLELDDFLQHF